MEITNSSKAGGITVKTSDPKDIVIQNLVIRPVIRSRADVQDWRSALIQAESTLGVRRWLYDLYADALLDPVLTSEINKRCGAVTKKLKFKDASGSENDRVNELLRKKRFKKMLREIVLSKMWGVTVLEVKPDSPDLFFSVPRKHIRPRDHRIVWEQYETDGETGIVYTDPPYSNYIIEICEDSEDLGLILKAVPYVLIKRGDIGDWAQFVEVFGMPFRKAEYDPFDETSRALMEKALETAGSAPWMLLPKGGTFELIQNTGTAANGDIYEKLKDACDEQILILITGSTETTKSSKSSGYAQSKTHENTKQDVLDEDRDFVVSVLNENFIPLMDSHGWGLAGGEFYYEDEDPLETRQGKIAILQSMKAMGTPVSDEMVYDASGFGKPDNYDELKQVKQPDPPGDPGDDPDDQEDRPPAEDDPETARPERLPKEQLSRGGFWHHLRTALADFFDPAP
jgi:hypothetical protein